MFVTGTLQCVFKNRDTCLFHFGSYWHSAYLVLWVSGCVGFGTKGVETRAEDRFL